MKDGLDPGLLAALDAIPFDTSEAIGGARMASREVRGLADIVVRNLPKMNERALRWQRGFPEGWERVQVDVGEDARLGGILFRGEPGAPVILFAPGTFHTKDDGPRRRRLVRLQEEFGATVLAIDLRGFGESHALLGTGGHLEALDLLAAAAWLKREARAERVTVIGESLGGASALVAASKPDARDLFAGVLAWSPFADLRAQTAFSSKNPGVRHPYYLGYRVFGAMVRARSKGELQHFEDFLAMRAKELGVSVEDLTLWGSPAACVQDVRVPSLIFHAQDDAVVSVAAAHAIAEAAKGNPWVRVHILPSGAHLRFEERASAWYWATTRTAVMRLR